MENLKEQVERDKLFQKATDAYKTGHVLLEAATGAGKTFIALRLIKSMEKWVIVVPKLVLIDNWTQEFLKHDLGKMLDLGTIEFITYASLEKYQATNRKRNVILDEAHNLNERRYVAAKDILNLISLSKKGTGRGHLIALSGSIDEERRPLLYKLGIYLANTVRFTTDHAVKADIVRSYNP